MKLQIRFAGAVAAILCFSCMDVAVASGTPITHELLWMMKRVGAPVVSPDGKWVVFAVLEPSYEPDKEISDLWLVPADGGAPPRRITNTRATESGVAWSPDSRSIAFSTRREGDDAEQIYILDLAGGGEARRLTELVTGASSPKWRPDGKAILFESAVYPNALDDEANRKKSRPSTRPVNTTSGRTSIFRCASGTSGSTTGTRRSWCNRCSPARNPRTCCPPPRLPTARASPACPTRRAPAPRSRPYGARMERRSCLPLR